MNDSFIAISSLSEEIVEVQLNDPIFRNDIKDDSYYYRDSYKEFLKEYDEELNFIDDDIEDSDYIDNSSILSNNTVINKIVDDLELYQEMYRVPEYNLPNSEWDMLFDNLYEWYLSNNLLEYYYEDMLRLNRVAVAKTLVYDKSSLDINAYIESISFLESDTMELDDLELLQSHLDEEINGNKVIDFNKCLTLKKNFNS